MKYSVCLLADNEKQWLLDLNDKQLSKVIRAHDYGEEELSLPGLKFIRFSGFQQINIYENSKGWGREQVSQFLEQDAPNSGLGINFPKKESLLKIGNEVTDQFLDEGFGYKKGSCSEKSENEMLYNVYLHAGHFNKQIELAMSRAQVLKVSETIGQGRHHVMAAGRKFELKDFRVFKVYDVSKCDNQEDAGLLKDEIQKQAIAFSKGKITQGLLKDLGMDVTHLFPTDSTINIGISLINDHYVDPSRIQELRDLNASSKWDLKTLVTMSLEINITYQNEAWSATGMLLRTILDHVPLVFGFTSFKQVANNYNGTSSFKKIMKHLQGGFRNIADGLLHNPISKHGASPNKVQVDFRSELDVLFQEVINIIKAEN